MEEEAHTELVKGGAEASKPTLWVDSLAKAAERHGEMGCMQISETLTTLAQDSDQQFPCQTFHTNC